MLLKSPLLRGFHVHAHTYTQARRRTRTHSCVHLLQGSQPSVGSLQLPLRFFCTQACLCCLLRPHCLSRGQPQPHLPASTVCERQRWESATSGISCPGEEPAPGQATGAISCPGELPAPANATSGISCPGSYLLLQLQRVPTAALGATCPSKCRMWHRLPWKLPAPGQSTSGISCPGRYLPQDRPRVASAALGGTCPRTGHEWHQLPWEVPAPARLASKGRAWHTRDTAPLLPSSNRHKRCILPSGGLTCARASGEWPLCICDHVQEDDQPLQEASHRAPHKNTGPCNKKNVNVGWWARAAAGSAAAQHRAPAHLPGPRLSCRQLHLQLGHFCFCCSSPAACFRHLQSARRETKPG